MKARALKLNRLQNPMVFWGLILVIILLAGLYVYMVNRTIWNVVERQKAEKSLATLNSDTSQLESTYMSMKNGIDLQMAHTLGFNSAPITKYINRTTLGKISSHPIE